MAGPFRFPRGQAPSLRGTIQADATRGRPRVRAWPRKRSAAEVAAQKDRTEWFAQAQQLTKYVTRGQMVAAFDATRGTPFYPRDILTMAMAGRVFVFHDPDGNEVWPLAIRTDVSQALDIIGKSPGALLWRDTNNWNIINPGTAGQYLTSQGPGAAPAWQPASGGGSITGSIGRTSNFSTGSDPGAVSWQVANWDDEGLWNVSSPTRLTIQRNGRITCSFCAQISNAQPPSNAALWWYKNGSEIGCGPAGHQWSLNTVLPWIPVTAGDYIELYLRHLTGKTLQAVRTHLSYDFRPT